MNFIMGRYINPFTDWGFKQIFGQEANKDILIFFLNALLKGERVITDLKFLDKEHRGDHDDDRFLIYDVYCQTDTGEHIIVEMQNRKQPFFMDRSLYYVSRSVVSQAMKGEKWDNRLTAVYGVFFMNFTQGGSLEKKLRTDVILSDRETGQMVSDKVRIIYLQLPYFHKTEEECSTDFERFIYVLKKMDIVDRLPFEKRNRIFAKLAQIAEVYNYSESQQWAYDQSLKHMRDANAVLMGAIEEGEARGIARGLRKGLAKGREEGREEGLAQGLAQGRKEAEEERRKAFEEKRNTARILKASGVGIEVIKASTGLSEEEIKDL